MALTNHKELRRCAQWAYPGTLAVVNAAWDGVEDMQTYITREWAAQPSKTLPTAVQIAAQETAWRKAIATAIWREKIAATDAVTPRAMEDLVDALITKGVLVLTDLSPKMQTRITTKKTLRAKRPV